MLNHVYLRERRFFFLLTVALHRRPEPPRVGDLLPPVEPVVWFARQLQPARVVTPAAPRRAQHRLQNIRVQFDFFFCSFSSFFNNVIAYEQLF